MADEFESQRQKKAANDLRASRNRARIQQQRTSAPVSSRGAGNPQKPDSALTRFENAEARRARDLHEYQHRQDQGQPTGLAQRAALEQLRRSERMKQGYLAAARAGETDSKKKGKSDDKDYPNPIGTLSFFIFGFVAMIQDLVPLVFDLLGVGWIVGYLLLPFTWFCYWYIIVRRAPKSLQRKFIMRTALVSAAGLIPYLGEILPEWIATAIGAYIYIKRYESGASGIEEISATTKNLVQGKSAS